MNDYPIDTLIQTLRESSQKRRESFGYEQRRIALTNLAKTVRRNRLEIIAALGQDQGKAPDEVDVVEIIPTLSEISHAISHLARWMRPRRVWPTALMIGTTTRILPQAKGVVLIIAPWNFPLLLALGPVASAIAAGNAVVLKPSEMTPATSALLVKICAQAFPDGLVQVVEGGPDVSRALLTQRFDHIFFTGSPAVGRIVMQAAAHHLTPVTLELGGKSPVILTHDADLVDAARWIVWGKGVNAGQICVAPDHVFVPQSLLESLAQTIEAQFALSYGADVGASPDYCQIVNQRHFSRLMALLDDAVQKGATVRAFGQDQPERTKIAPRLLLGTTPEMEISHEEIFGPLLPLIPYDDLSDVIDKVNASPKPLILYIFAKSRSVISRISGATQSGSVGVNLTLMPFIHGNIGFGGVGASGMGEGHGRAGFDTFSHLKPVMKNQFTLLTLLFPPYGPKVKRMVRLLLAYLK